MLSGLHRLAGCAKRNRLRVHRAHVSASGSAASHARLERSEVLPAPPLFESRRDRGLPRLEVARRQPGENAEAKAASCHRRRTAGSGTGPPRAHAPGRQRSHERPDDEQVSAPFPLGGPCVRMRPASDRRDDGGGPLTV
jgi:hypothetical protein